ncbi:MAG TPA: hypothetical protein VK447_16840 [Myxococcaceae bacterium]|nr:hypothetical protein [Myxococcaceae bacterium]
MTGGTLILLSALLAQPPEPKMPGAELASALPQVTRSAGPLPVMRQGAEIRCTELAPSREVPSGRYRVQCDEAKKTCLAAPNRQLGPDGVETLEGLDHVSNCPFVASLGTELASDGYRFVEAIVDSDPGWAHDERGRAIQISFELNARTYLGLGYAPWWNRQLDWNLRRVRAEFGIQSEFSSGRSSGPTLHRMRVLEGNITLGEQYTLEGVLIHYDNSVDRVNPIRVTSLVGRPARGELSLDLGFWADVVRLESVRRGGADNTFVTWGSLQTTVDLWHSRDMTSYVRLRVGGGVETDLVRRFTVLKPQAAFEGDLTLDTNGIHHLRFAAEAEKLFLAPEVFGRPLNPDRLRVRAGYETVVLAINDKPFTLVLEGRGVWRNDLPSAPPAWEWTAHAGLRFSLGVSPRRTLE